MEPPLPKMHTQPQTGYDVLSQRRGNSADRQRTHPKKIFPRQTGQRRKAVPSSDIKIDGMRLK